MAKKKFIKKEAAEALLKKDDKTPTEKKKAVSGKSMRNKMYGSKE